MLYEEATSLYLSDSSNNGTSQSCLDQSPCIRVPSSPRWHGNAWKQELTWGRASDRSPNAQEEIGKGEWKAASMIRSLPPGLAGRQAGRRRWCMPSSSNCAATTADSSANKHTFLVLMKFSPFPPKWSRNSRLDWQRRRRHQSWFSKGSALHAHQFLPINCWTAFPLDCKTDEEHTNWTDQNQLKYVLVTIQANTHSHHTEQGKNLHIILLMYIPPKLKTNHHYSLLNNKESKVTCLFLQGNDSHLIHRKSIFPCMYMYIERL